MNNVNLFSNRCPPCRSLYPTISSLADRYDGRVNVCRIDVGRVPAVAQRYAVRAIPIALFIRNGKEVGRLVGLQSETKYVALLDELVGKDRN